MDRKVVYAFIAIYSFAAGLGFFLSSVNKDESTAPHVASYIVQGQSTEAAIDAVLSVDGQITHELQIINAVEVSLTAAQHELLLMNAEIIAIDEGVAEAADTDRLFDRAIM